MTTKPMAAALPAFEGRAATEKRHPLGWLKREAKRRPVYVAAAFFLAVAVFTALTGPMWPLLADPKEPALGDRLLAPFSSGGESRYYLAGSDNLGRDIFARTVTGARASIGIAALVVVVAGVCGTAIGLLAGYAGGKVDLVVMRAVDLQIAFPSLVLAIFLLYLVGNSMTNLVLLLVLLSWAGFARIARAETLSIRNQQFVEGAVAIGATDLRVMVRHIVPHLVAVVAVVAVFDFSGVMLAEASLSFLGLGVQPPDSSWGLMLSDGREYVYTGGWWLFLIPGVALSLTALCANLTSRWVQELAHVGG